MTDTDRILLLTDIPPCQNYTGGIVLDQLCSFIPKERLACYCILNPELTDAKLSPSLQGIPYKQIDKPNENSYRITKGRLGKLSSYLKEYYISQLIIPKIAKDVIQFARDNNIKKIWCLLEGQTTIQVAHYLAKNSSFEILTEIWDPPTWWLRDRKIDFRSTQRILSQYDEAIRLSKKCATASIPMAERYKKNLGVQTIPFLPSLPKDLCRPPGTLNKDSNQFIITLAGQLYASEEILALQLALNTLNWKIGNKKVVLRVIGRQIAFNTNQEVQIEFYGWRYHKELIELLSQSDLNYCPYWFTETFREESSLCFPSKLSTYLASGKPALYHGPEYGSPASFLTTNNAGYCCYTLNPNSIADTLKQIASDSERYKLVTKNAFDLFNRMLTLEHLKNSFEDFIS